MTEQELAAHKRRMLSYALKKIRTDAMINILDDLADGHPNPEGFLEWLEAKDDEAFVKWWKEVNEGGESDAT